MERIIENCLSKDVLTVISFKNQKPTNVQFKKKMKPKNSENRRL